MFKKFDSKESVSGVNNVKSSVQRSIRTTLLDVYPSIKHCIDDILPKKGGGLKVVKCHEHIELLAAPSGEVLFFKERDGPYCPTLKLLHKYPYMLPHMQVDAGAIKFVLSGANVMCPGLTSPGARMAQVPKNAIVAVTAEGKEHAMAVGVTMMSSEDILAKNKGHGIESLHYLGDGLWHMKPVK